MYRRNYTTTHDPSHIFYVHAQREDWGAHSKQQPSKKYAHMPLPAAEKERWDRERERELRDRDRWMMERERMQMGGPPEYHMRNIPPEQV